MINNFTFGCPWIVMKVLQVCSGYMQTKEKREKKMNKNRSNENKMYDYLTGCH